MVLRAKPEKIEEKERIRGALLEATIRLSALHGFASLGLREVSREASIAPTSFYRHFEDMQALGLAIIRDKVTPFMMELRALHGAAASDAAALVDALCRAVQREPELTRFLLAERVGSFAGFRGALNDTLHEFAARLATTLGGATASLRHEAAPLAALILLEAAAELLDSSAEDLASWRTRTLTRLRSIWHETPRAEQAS